MINLKGTVAMQKMLDNQSSVFFIQEFIILHASTLSKTDCHAQHFHWVKVMQICIAPSVQIRPLSSL